jgi:hypothetical protein
MTTTPRRVSLWRVFLLLVLVVQAGLSMATLGIYVAGAQPPYWVLLQKQSYLVCVHLLVLLAGLAPRIVGLWLCALGEWLITWALPEED